MDKLTSGEIADLATTYAVWLLHDSNIAIDADKLQALLEASGVQVPAFYTKVYAKAVTAKSLDNIITASTSISAAGGASAAPAAASAAPTAAAAPAEEKKPAQEDEDDDVFGGGDDGGGMGLFGGDDDY